MFSTASQKDAAMHVWKEERLLVGCYSFRVSCVWHHSSSFDEVGSKDATLFWFWLICRRDGDILLLFEFFRCMTKPLPRLDETVTCIQRYTRINNDREDVGNDCVGTKTLNSESIFGVLFRIWARILNRGFSKSHSSSLFSHSLLLLLPSFYMTGRPHCWCD